MKFKTVTYNPDSLPIRFSARGTDLSQFHTKNEKVALYVVAFGELFGELDNESKRSELISILHALNQLLADPLIEVRFLEFMIRKDIDGCIPKINQYLGEKNEVVKLLKEQQKEEHNLTTFGEDCKSENIKTVFLGGIHGTACVWATAAKYAKNIYAKLLPDDNHPNIRYLTKQHHFLFKTAIIIDNICEGHTINSQLLFNQYLCFPSLREFSVESGHDYINNVTYRTNVEKLQNQDKKACADYAIFATYPPKPDFIALHKKMQEMIIPAESKKRKRDQSSSCELISSSSGSRGSSPSNLLPNLPLHPFPLPLNMSPFMVQLPLSSPGLIPNYWGMMASHSLSLQSQFPLLLNPLPTHEGVLFNQPSLSPYLTQALFPTLPISQDSKGIQISLSQPGSQQYSQLGIPPSLSSSTNNNQLFKK